MAITKWRRHKIIPEASYPNDPTKYEAVKVLGMFAVQHITPETRLGRVSVAERYAGAGITAGPDVSFLDLHLRRPPGKDEGLQAVRRSLGLVADYAQFLRSEDGTVGPDEIVGVTDPALGRVARRLGFEMHDVNASGLPLILAQKIGESIPRIPRPDDIPAEPSFRPGYTSNTRDQRVAGLDVGRFVVVHLPTDDFIARYGDVNVPAA